MLKSQTGPTRVHSKTTYEPDLNLIGTKICELLPLLLQNT